MADDSGRTFALAVTFDGHGGQHFQYYDTTNNAPDITVAIETSSGGGVNAPQGLQRPLTDNGNTRYVIGTNQHGQANAAYIPVSSNFSPAGQ